MYILIHKSTGRSNHFHTISKCRINIKDYYKTLQTNRFKFASKNTFAYSFFVFYFLNIFFVKLVIRVSCLRWKTNLVVGVGSSRWLLELVGKDSHHQISWSLEVAS